MKTSDAIVNKEEAIRKTKIGDIDFIDRSRLCCYIFRKERNANFRLNKTFTLILIQHKTNVKSITKFFHAELPIVILFNCNRNITFVKFDTNADLS